MAAPDEASVITGLFDPAGPFAVFLASVGWLSVPGVEHELLRDQARI